MSKELQKLMRRNPSLFDEYRRFVVTNVVEAIRERAAKAASK